MALFKFIHLLAVLIWVGGMFFAYVVLRPATAEALDLPQRMNLWAVVLRLFFNWVWASAGIILITGFYPDLPMWRHHPCIASCAYNAVRWGSRMMVIHGYMFFNLLCAVQPCMLPNRRWKEGGRATG